MNSMQNNVIGKRNFSVVMIKDFLKADYGVYGNKKAIC